jgi:starch synthase
VSAPILHLTAELWPYARTGGLGQAVADIATFQAKSDMDVAVLLPFYRTVRQHAGKLIPLGPPFTVTIGGITERLQAWELAPDPKRPRVLLLEHNPSFDRAGIYGENGADYPDNFRRFALFALGAVEVAAQLAPDVLIHAHDWHAALAPVYLRTAAADQPDRRKIPCVITVHNGGFQGVFAREVMMSIGLPEYLWSAEYMEWYGRLNYLKGGLILTDMVTTVSPTHAQEIRTDVGGFGLQDVFRGLGDRLLGVRNGIDVDIWDPTLDPDLTSHYRAENLRGKARCKVALQRAWTLPEEARTPLFAMSARLVAQKGLDLIVGSRRVREGDAQFVFLGSGEARYEAALAELAREYPDRIALNTAFTDVLEHRLLAGADFLLMPCLYEPCGLTQMRAQRYGTLPIARRVGGLNDTIIDGVTGFLFDDYTPAAFDEALDRAFALYEDRTELRERVRDAMRRDFSWTEPLAQYAAVYRRARARAGAGGGAAR